MTTSLIGPIILWLIVAIIFIAVIVYLLDWLYRRSTKETAFVRTGLGGEAVIINGGAFVFPIVHEVTPVNLNVVRIPVTRVREEAVIAKDRIRVDIEAEFFVRVLQEPKAVAAAASTLGRKTLEPAGFSDLLSGKFIAAIQSAAAEMTLDEMHENRSVYINAVAERAAEALARNGLELESVAIINLDQTDLEFFNSANRFDAEGLTQLIKTIEERREMRNDIEQSSMVAIRARNLDAEKKTLKLQQESENARLNQERELETIRAKQQADITSTRLAREAEAEKSRIANEQALDKARIERDKQLRSQKISMQHAVEETEISTQEELERARIASERGLDEARIHKERDLKRMEIERSQVLELAEIESQILILIKQSEEADVRAATEVARGRAVEAEELVTTTREKVAAERIATIDRLLAEKDADTAKIAAEADKISAVVAAEAQRLLNEAENLLSDDARATKLRAKMIDHLEGIVRESVRPLESIEGIKILHVDGLSGGGGGGQRSPTDEVIESALRYRAQAPLIDQMMKEIGIENAGVTKMGDVFRAAKDAQSLAKEAEASKKKDN